MVCEKSSIYVYLVSLGLKNNKELERFSDGGYMLGTNCKSKTIDKCDIKYKILLEMKDTHTHTEIHTHAHNWGRA